MPWRALCINILLRYCIDCIGDQPGWGIPATQSAGLLPGRFLSDDGELLAPQSTGSSDVFSHCDNSKRGMWNSASADYSFCLLAAANSYLLVAANSCLPCTLSWEKIIPEATLSFHVPALPTIGLPLLGIAFPLTYVLSQTSCLAFFKLPQTFLFGELGSGASLNSHLKGTLYKLHR